MRITLLTVSSIISAASAWVIIPQPHSHSTTSSSPLPQVQRCRSHSSSAAALLLSSSSSLSAVVDANVDVDVNVDDAVDVVDTKECVKLFGRLADKFILLDASGGKCCYSACKDCEFRLPGGGYIMADQSSARPKWIPIYSERSNNDNNHVSKWSQELFSYHGSSSNENENDGKKKKALKELDRDEFDRRVHAVSYAQPLGGPSVSASVAAEISQSTLNRLWDLLRDNKKDRKKGRSTLTLRGMSQSLTRMAEQQQGVTWKQFLAAMQQPQLE